MIGLQSSKACEMQALLLFNILERRISTDFMIKMRELTLLGVSILLIKSIFYSDDAFKISTIESDFVIDEKGSRMMKHNDLRMVSMSIQRMQRSWPTTMRSN